MSKYYEEVKKDLERRAKEMDMDIEEYCDYVLSASEPEDDLIIF